jgi:hypothetical protein
MLAPGGPVVARRPRVEREEPEAEALPVAA